jgi:hypothetical protein
VFKGRNILLNWKVLAGACFIISIAANWILSHFFETSPRCKIDILFFNDEAALHFLTLFWSFLWFVGPFVVNKGQVDNVSRLLNENEVGFLSFLEDNKGHIWAMYFIPVVFLYMSIAASPLIVVTDIILKMAEC